MANLRFIIAGGGTGGHLFPALAIVDELKRTEPNAEILFIGTKDKLEERVVPQRGYEFRSIWISGFHRRRLLKNILFPVKLLVSIMQARSIIKQIKPSVIIGTGGYVSGPVLYAATMMHIPAVIHEQNSYPGITTRLLGTRVNEVYLTFSESRKHLKQTNNVIVTGNPTRSSLERVNRVEAHSYFGFDQQEKKRTVLIFGGSLGAHTINQAVLKNLNVLMQSNVRVIWQTGQDDYEEMKKASSRYSSSAIWVNTFIDRMEFAYAVSDLVVCRAGATTIAELTRLGKPAILIPYPHAAANHQLHNATMLAEAGAAALLRDEEVTEKLAKTVMDLFNNEAALRRMGDACKKLGKPNAAREIVERILALTKTTNR